MIASGGFRRFKIIVTYSSRIKCDWRTPGERVSVKGRDPCLWFSCRPAPDLSVEIN